MPIAMPTMFATASFVLHPEKPFKSKMDIHLGSIGLFNSLLKKKLLLLLFQLFKYILKKYHVEVVVVVDEDCAILRLGFLPSGSKATFSAVPNDLLQFESLFISVFVIIVIMYFINASVNIFGALKQMLLIQTVCPLF